MFEQVSIEGWESITACVCVGGGTHREEARCGLVAVHGDGRRVVERVQHLHGEGVPLHLGVPLRHADLAAHTLVVAMKPGAGGGLLRC